MRKLAIASFSFSAAIFASNYIFTHTSSLYAALVCALLGAAVLGTRLKSLRGIVISLFAAAVGFAVFSAHYDLTVEKAHQLAGQTRETSFVLLESPREYKNYVSAEAVVREDGMPRLKCILYDYDKGIAGLNGGDLITAEVRLSAADLRYGEHVDTYNARNIYLKATLKGSVRTEGHQNSLTSVASAAADVISRRVENIFDAQTASFIKALTIGDKTDLYDDDALYVSLSRSGLMHVVAVSGMHVSYLVAFLQFLLGRGKRSSIGCIILVWIFVSVSGMSPSAVRAAFMQSMLLLAPLFNRENDPLTSLSAALAIMLLCNPFAAANISLQLSFAAMLGIVLLAERMEEFLTAPMGEGRAASVLKLPIGIVSCTLSVLVFTLPITTAYFGYFSPLSPLTNLLCLWVVPLCFIGSFTACAFSQIPLIGRLLCTAVTYLTKYILFICRTISSLNFSAIYLPGWLNTLCFLLFYLSIALVFLLKLKPRLRLLIPILTAVFSLTVSCAALNLHYSSAKATLTAVDVGQGACICVSSGKNVVMVDCGSTSYAEYNAGDCAAAYLRSCGYRKIDALVFTHLHTDHINGYKRLANLIEIEKIIIPSSVEGDDTFLEMLLTARIHGTEIEVADETTMEQFGSIRLFMISAAAEGKDNERCMPVIVSVGDYDVIITGDAPASTEKELVQSADLSVIEALVVGHHGSKSASCEEYLSALAGDTAIISVGKNSYGLPSAEVLERLERFGYTVYRTDRDGNVEIRIDG